MEWAERDDHQKGKCLLTYEVTWHFKGLSKTGKSEDIKWPRGKEKYQSTDNIKIGKKEETPTQKMKRSPDERHT